MHVISKKRLDEFSQVHADAETALTAWYRIADKAEWKSFADVRAVFARASAVDKFTVFDIRGNNYRLITEINYERHMIFIRHLLTHEEYDRGSWKQG